MILAGIDIGTNTLRLLIADTGPRSFHEIHADRRITRLGASLDRTGLLSLEARERTLAVLGEFTASISKAGCRAVDAVGTSALRNAKNTAVFLEQVRARTGLAVRVIDGREEARLTLLGVCTALGEAAACPGSVVIDIGGGSTEVVGGDPAIETSLPLGAVYLTERFLSHDPPLHQELDRLRTAIRDALRSALPSSFRPRRLIGTAGTITTLASMYHQMADYDPARINSSRLTRDWIAETVQRLSASTSGERRGMTGLERGREDIILAGAVIVHEMLEQWQLEDLTVSDWGLREGIVFGLYDRMMAGEAERRSV